MQLVHAYNKVCERNDQSLFHYGFVQDLDPPLLSALDTPNGNLYDAASHTEADYGRPLQEQVPTATENLQPSPVCRHRGAAHFLKADCQDEEQHSALIQRGLDLFVWTKEVTA